VTDDDKRALERDIQLPAILAGACLIGIASVLLVVIAIVPAVRALCLACR
jgi:hypothetical protein